MNAPKARRNTITRYRLTEEHLVGESREAVRNYDLLSVITLCPGGPEWGNYDGVLRMLDVLLGSETGEAEKRKILRDEYDIQMTQTMEQEVSVMCNLSKGVMEKGMEKGMAAGMAKGRAEGRAEGAAENTVVSIKNLMETLELTIEQAMAALKVPESERQKYLELLEQQ